MTHIYRDKTAPSHRVVIPIEESISEKVGGFMEPRWSVKCLEIMQTVGHHLEVRSTFMPVAVLERHYRKEEL